LQFLADNKISLTLDSELKEKVDRYPFKGKPYVYAGLSNGQRRRLILALSQALAHIQMLNVGAAPSAIWLDEVSINLDEAGIEGAYRMICELAKEKQVFVIDHNESLLQSLDGCDTIYLQMQEAVTTRVDSFSN
jgi:energy-coupling factor transporter ATP-binding protein EcfA2